MLVVVDTSVAIKWAVTEVFTPQADALADALLRAGERLYAPQLLVAEVTNVLHDLARAGTVTWAEADGAIDDILAVVTVREMTPALAKRALALAHQTNQTYAYDTQFLALAEHLGCDLWTADERFVRGMQRHGFASVRSLRTYPLPTV